jgi:ferritin-like metal-binding protein YciE
MSRTLQEQLNHFLSDMYSVEQQALAQLVSAPDLAGDPSIASDFRVHHTETEQQAALIGERLEAHGETPSSIKDAIMKLGGKGFLLFARLLPETPGRLVAHSYSYEAMEWAGYEMLILFAEKAGDAQTAAVARIISDQERAMMERLELGFDAAERASHRDTPPEKMGEDLRKHLEEAHALESQGIQLLSKSDDIAGDPQLAQICSRHLEDSHNHARLLEERLDALGGSPSGLKDIALGLGGLNWGFFFQAQPDTPAKLAAFAYAYEHLKIGGYELLKRTARRAGDAETERLCETLLTEERTMAGRLTGAFASAVQATLAAVRSESAAI